jgi:hypothetical protein
MHALRNGNVTIVNNYTWEVPKGSYNTYWKVEKCEHLCNYPMSSLFFGRLEVMGSQLNRHKDGELCKLKTLFGFWEVSIIY